MSKPTSRLAMAALVAALAPAAALGTTYTEHLNVDDMMARSESVVRGEVIAAQGRWTANGLIETVVTVDVDDVYAGDVGDTIQVVAPGGTVGGVTLGIQGTAEFEVGDDVLVFADGRRIVGFGQGAFRVDEQQQATRSMGNAVPDFPVSLDMDRAFGHPEEAESCLETRVDQTYSDGWHLRGATDTRVGREDVALWRVNLIGGMEYRLDACADGLLSDARLILTDENGKSLAWAEPGMQPSLTFAPDATDIYYVGLYAEDLPAGVWRGAAAISILYR